MEPQLKLSTLLLPMICGLIWGGAAWLGLDLERGVQERAGGVELGQVIYTVVFPFAALTFSLVPSVFLSQTRYAKAGNLWCVLFVLLAFPYLVALDGGM